MTEQRDQLIRDALGEALEDPQAVEAAFADPDRDLFDLGLDSLRTFGVLERLAGEGVEVDFLEFTSTPTVGFLRGAGA